MEALVLELDAQAERSVSWLRLVAAAVVGVSAVAILVGAHGTLSVIIGLLGLGASIGWVFAFRSSGQRVANRENYFLRLDDEGVTLSQGGDARQVPWAEVIEAAVDEQRLVVVLQLRGGGTFDIPPIFRGHGIYEIEDLVNERQRAASTADGG